MRPANTRVRTMALVALVVALTATAGLAQERKFGLKLATPEQLRGIPMAATPFAGAELPRKVDMADRMPPVGDQGAQSSCVAFSVAYALKSFQERNEERWDVSDGQGHADPRHVFSPAFVYNQINNGEDGGSLFIDALNVLSKTGACPLSEMPYTDRDCKAKPTAQAVAAAARYRIDFWRQVNLSDPKEVKAQLNAGYPVVFGAKVDQGFQDAKPGFVWKEKTKVLGGHAMILVGYDDDRKAFHVMNSWGNKWCEDGFGWIDYDFIREVASEAYVVKDAINTAPPRPPVDPTPRPDPRPTPDPRPVPPNPDPNPVDPTPVAPNPLAPDIAFQLIDVRHNVPGPNGMPGMVFFGRVTMPGGMGRAEQVVVQFFANDGRNGIGPPVRATMIPFADVNGLAATGTPPFAIPPQGLDNAWTAWVPYTAFRLNIGWVQTPVGWRYVPGRADLIARPTLFIDNFGVKVGPAVPFFVGF